ERRHRAADPGAPFRQLPPRAGAAFPAWVFLEGSSRGNELDGRCNQGHAAACLARGGEGQAARMNGRPENRVEKIVADLLRGRRLKLRGGDAEGKPGFTPARRLGAGPRGPRAWKPRFRSRPPRPSAHRPREGWSPRVAPMAAA